MTPEEMQDMFGGADPFSDFFHTFFDGEGAGAAGAPRRAQRPRPRRGSDLETTIDLSLEDAFSGATRRVQTKHDGHARTVDVRIPAGVKDGARVRVAGEGEPAPPNGSAGDLFLVVHVQPHPRFERDGADLRTRVALPITTAVLGGEVGVVTLSGSTLRLKVPELTASGRVFRLRGHGMPAVGKPDQRGDIYATVEIQMPAALRPEERELYEKLQSLEVSHV